ncbi:MAG TPA: cytochrome c [Steroidobacteraceae bacterium]|jgi:mono/diheme cytochrome c family protein
MKGAKGWTLIPICILVFAAACSRQSAPAGEERGADLYSQNCLACHREKGEGVAGVYPSLAGSPAVLGDPIELTQWVLSQKRPASIPAGRYPTQMLLFGWMKDEDAAALLTYIRNHFGNAAPPVDAATVAKAREK